MHERINAAFQPTRDMMRETARSALSPLRELLEVPVLLTPFALEESPAVSTRDGIRELIAQTEVLARAEARMIWMTAVILLVSVAGLAVAILALVRA